MRKSPYGLMAPRMLPKLPLHIKTVAAILVCALSLTGCVTSSSGNSNSASAAAKPAPAINSSAVASTAATFTSSATPGNSAYKIGPQDVLDVTVFQVPDLSRSIQVADNGTINYPLIGIVSTNGKTAQQVEHDISTRLAARYLQSPQVTVYVKEYNSQRVTVDGAVRKPGVYPIRSKTSLLQAIALAEGLNTDIASSTVVVFRQQADKRSVARFNIDDIRAGKAEDPSMQQGDVIVVDTSQGMTALSYVSKILPVASLFRPF